MRRSSFHRLPTGGRIERVRSISFSLDGRRVTGCAGDTLASALLANGAAIVGRSFKYHRPRGIMTAGVEEPNGLLTLGQAGRREPNIPATTTDLVDGIVAETQNGWPSTRFDLQAVNSLAAPLLAAGFYYKTFMGPTRGSWMFYEPFIRRAAGLGKGTFEPDPDRYEGRHDFADVLVIGGGPAGLAAAIAAGRTGARVTLAEQDALLGGSLLAEPVGTSADAWLAERVAELESLGNVRVLTRTTAAGLYDGNTVVLVERRDHRRPDPAKGEARQVAVTLRAKAIVFAAGALERPLVFNNNDRPGVMLAGAVRTYLNRFAVSPGRRAVVVTNNDSAYRTAFDLARAGLAVTIADLRQDADAGLRARAAAAGIELRTGTAVVDVAGRGGVYGAMLAGVGSDDTPTLESCDVVCMSGGWSPVLHLTSHTGIKPRYDPAIAAFVPGGFAAGHVGAGAVIGSFGLVEAVRGGFEAGRRAAAHAGHDAPASELPLPDLEPVGHAIEPVWEVAPARGGRAFVDLQNDVTAKDVRLAHREGYQSVEHLKRYTTLGMGTDQGKTSNINALAIMAGLRGVDIPAAGTTTFRPPYSPVAIGALAGRSIGHHFRPIRRSPLHDWHIANGGEMIEAGPWLRAWYYRWSGDTPAKAYVEEMKLVRKGVGLADVSTLGKIDVQGPDAAEFLNRVYVNGFAKLPVGKARYGIMLNDDGLVLDDGTTTRLSETRYFMTTTTAQAGEVMSWLEFLLQTAWTDLRVHVSSLSDEWAAMAVSGPKARAALGLAFPGHDFGNERLPHMGCLEIAHDGAPVRIIRLSFSGELAYEVYTPADYGIALWEHILASAASLGIKPYGLEALASLRVEKGHVAGLELDHRTSLDDLALGKMASKDKPYIGRELRQRPELQAPERWSLVGLECLEPAKRLRGGAILFAAGDAIRGHGRGYISSVTWSTELEKYIALGLYQGGLKHAGEEIVCAFPLKNEQVRARIVAPHFVDPKNERLHA
jgi:heterotetrameric sarcosine oxidase alpha subunit